MGCKIAENHPLRNLRTELGLPMICHSMREEPCMHKLEKPSGNYTMGIPGAVLGYCQALFVKTTDTKTNTRHIIDLLEEANAPWHKSHELYWGNKSNESVNEFITQSVEPLLGTGRMPILITPLNPNKDSAIIREILNTDPLVFEGETTLVRIVLTDNDSVEMAATLMQEVLSEARKQGKMPKFWTLLQGQLKYNEWQHLKNIMGDDWKYVNIAINPFTVDGLPDFLWEQITVAQVVLGHKEGVFENGTIQLPLGMKIAGADECDEYNLHEFFSKLEKLKIVPTLIILGPSLPDWDNKYNLERIEKLLPLLRQSCNKLWRSLSDKRKDAIWELIS